MVGFVGYCGWEISHNSKLDSLIYIIYLTAMVTLGLIVLLTLFFLIIEFFIKLEYQVGEIKKLVQGKKKNVSLLTDDSPVFLQVNVENI